MFYLFLCLFKVVYGVVQEVGIPLQLSEDVLGLVGEAGLKEEPVGHVAGHGVFFALQVFQIGEGFGEALGCSFQEILAYDGK